MTGERAALALVLATSGALLGGAFLFQHVGGLAPCEMCYWQRYGHVAVLAVGLLAWALRSRALTGISAVSLLVAGSLGAFHAGVERGWWHGPTACSAGIDFGNGGALGQMLNTPLVRCDQIAWQMAGISMAGWNFLISAAAALAALALLIRSRHAPLAR